MSNDGDVIALRSIATKFVSGSFAGVVQIAVSHPLDLIKSRLQAGEFGGSITSCVTSTLQHEGARAFYRGSVPPMAVAGLFNSILFASNEAWKQVLLCLTVANDEQGKMKTKDDFWIVASSAVLSAPICIAVQNPFNHFKIQMQLERGGKMMRMRDCVARIYKFEGWRGLQRGYWCGLLREIVGAPCYFVTQLRVKSFLQRRFLMFQHSDFHASLVSGGAAGIVYWTAVYHIDTVRTKIQAQQSTGGRLLTGRQIARNILTQQGVSGLYVGFAACLLRAVPANASVFAAVSVAEGYLEQKRFW